MEESFTRRVVGDNRPVGDHRQILLNRMSAKRAESGPVSPSFVNTCVTKSGNRTHQQAKSRETVILQAHGKNAPGIVGPVMVAAIVAVIGIVALFLMDFAPWNSPQGNDLGMRSAAVLSRAGAT